MISKMRKHFILFLFSIFIFSGCQEPMIHEPPYEGPPKQIITVQRAKELYDTYTSRRLPIIQKYEDSISQDSVGFNPSRYVEYDYETITQYIAFIEHEAKEANVEIAGMRFYFSNYPDSDKFPNGDVVKYPRKNTVFIVPTMNQNGKEVGFLIEETDGKKTAVPIYDRVGDTTRNKATAVVLPKAKMNQAGFLSSSSSSSSTVSLILDDGGVIPPPQQKTDFGD